MLARAGEGDAVDYRSSGQRSRLVAATLAVLLVSTACGSTPSGSASPAGSGAARATQSGNLDPQTVAAAAAANEPAFVDLLQALRDRSGLVSALGPAGPLVYAFIDGSEAEALRQLAAERLGPAALAGQVASAGGPIDRPAVPHVDDAVPITFTAWLLTAQYAEFPATDNGDHGAGQVPAQTQTFTSTTDGVTTSTDVTMAVTTSFDGNNLAVTLTISHDSTVTDASTGKVIGHPTGAVTSTVEFQGCPDADGLVIGRVRFTVQEGSADATSGGAYSKATTEENVHLFVDENAIAVRRESALDTSLSVRGSTSGTGPASVVTDDWDASIGYTSNWTRTGTPGAGSPEWTTDTAVPGQTSQTNDFRLVADRAAADLAFQKVVATSALATGLPMSFAIDSAERYWRNGNCVEVAILQGNGGDVVPGQQVQVVAQPRHKIDRVDLPKPVVAAFSGSASADPVGTAVRAPATFVYTAGQEPHDAGTLTLTSTSDRGIGMTSVTFTVATPETPSPATPTPAGGKPSLHSEPSWDVRFDGTVTMDSNDGLTTRQARLDVHSAVIPLIYDPTGGPTGRPIWKAGIGRVTGQGTYSEQGDGTTCQGTASGWTDVRIDWSPTDDESVLSLHFETLSSTGDPTDDTYSGKGVCTGSGDPQPYDSPPVEVLEVFENPDESDDPITLAAASGTYPFQGTYRGSDQTVVTGMVTVTLSRH